MSEIKIYLTLSEVEHLIFHKFFLINESRLKVDRAQRNYSIAILVKEDKLLHYDKQLLILFSIVDEFEIPEKEELLFINHYKVPRGKISLKSRNVRDDLDKDPELDLSKTNSQGITEKYLPLRNALLFLFKIYLDPKYDTGIKNSIEDVIHGMDSLSAYKIKLINYILEEKGFPLLPVSLKEIKPDSFFRYTWLGKFTVTELLDPIRDKLGDEPYASRKGWFKYFIDKEDTKAINSALKNPPDEFQDEISIMLGYYFASMFFENSNAETFDQDLHQKITELDYEHRNEVFAWAVFLQALFRQELSQLYFIPTYLEYINNLERLAFKLSAKDFSLSDKWVFPVKLPGINRDEEITEYIQLKNGSSKSRPKLISSDMAIGLFKSNLSQENISKIGLEIKPSLEWPIDIPNTAYFKDNKFILELASSPSEVLFYSSKDSKVAKYLNELKIKQKPFDKLFDKSKKVLMGILSSDPKENTLIHLYSILLSSNIYTSFEKAVFIWVVNEDIELVQSSTFDLEKKNMESNLKNMFSIPITLLIKNERVNSSQEIKRNLRNLLSNYNIENMEVIDQNFNMSKAEWLLSINSEYFIDQKTTIYSSFIEN